MSACPPEYLSVDLSIYVIRGFGPSQRRKCVSNSLGDFVLLTGAGKAFASYSQSTLTGRHRLLLLYTMFCNFLKRLEAD